MWRTKFKSFNIEVPTRSNLDPEIDNIRNLLPHSIGETHPPIASGSLPSLWAFCSCSSFFESQEKSEKGEEKGASERKGKIIMFPQNNTQVESAALRFLVS